MFIPKLKRPSKPSPATYASAGSANAIPIGIVLSIRWGLRNSTNRGGGGSFIYTREFRAANGLPRLNEKSVSPPTSNGVKNARSNSSSDANPNKFSCG